MACCCQARCSRSTCWAERCSPPAWVSTRATPTVSACRFAGTLVAVPWLGEQIAQMQVSMYEHDRHAVSRRSAPRARARARRASRRWAAAGHGGRTRVLSRRPRAHGRRSCAAAAPAALRAARTQDADQLDAGAGRVLGTSSTEIDAAAARAGLAHRHGARRIRPGPVRGEPASRGRRAARLRSRDPPQAARQGRRRCSTAWKRRSCRSPIATRPAAARTCTSACSTRTAAIFSRPTIRPAATLLRHAIGGLAATMADAMAVCAPTPNSYRRFQPEAYVPLNPSWAVNNRGVAFRVPHGPPASRRIEHRVAGADANPYLLAAAVLAGMHLGLTQRARSGPGARGQCLSRHDARRCR